MIGRLMFGMCAMAVIAMTHGFAIPPDTSSEDIAETAVEAGSFKTLAAALEAAELVETLQGKGPFTEFAPSHEAFAKLPSGTVYTLLKPENKKQLIAVLMYHVVPGKVMAADVVKLMATATVNDPRQCLGFAVSKR